MQAAAAAGSEESGGGTEACNTEAYELEDSVELQLVRMRCELFVLEASASAPIPFELITSGGKKATAKHKASLSRSVEGVTALLHSDSPARAPLQSSEFGVVVVRLCHYEARPVQAWQQRFLVDGSHCTRLRVPLSCGCGRKPLHMTDTAIDVIRTVQMLRVSMEAMNGAAEVLMTRYVLLKQPHGTGAASRLLKQAHRRSLCVQSTLQRSFKWYHSGVTTAARLLPADHASLEEGTQAWLSNVWLQQHVASDEADCQEGARLGAEALLGTGAAA